MRMIDADKLLELMKDQKEREIGAYAKGINAGLNIVKSIINDETQTPTAYDIGKVVKKLEERTDFLKNCTKYGNKNAEQQAESYSTMMMYEVADLVDDLIEIVKQGGVADDVCEWKSMIFELKKAEKTSSK